MNEFKLTTVVNIANVDPDVWLADPNNRYVGNRGIVHRGRFQGKAWPNSGWWNPCIKPTDDPIHGPPTRTDWENYIKRFEAYLVTQKLLMRELPTLVGKTLGTWFYAWDGLSRPRPLSHACVLADWANGLAVGERRWESIHV